MDIKDMKELIRAVSESDITNFEYEDDTQEIRIKKDTVQNLVTVQPNEVFPSQISPRQTGTVSESPQNVSGDLFNVVKSPLVGVFYSSASPEAEPFVKVGDKVSKGQVLGIIEAMKLMNDIESDFDGEIVEILVNNKDMVEYEQPLFKIR
ncbi:MAG: acetyl-CoA carboxylase biotin carboxyl carrier protein [Lachnospiraceae bacterium]